MTTKKKTLLGQFFTKDELWLKPQIVDFIKSTGCHTAFDPFAGGGHLLEVAKKLGLKKTIGYDIDDNLGWTKNDSLISIPHISDDTIIITNPPYLSNYSAARKGIIGQVKKYFDITDYDDLYLLALDNMLTSHKYIVAIIPETFINSNFKKKNYLDSITILEENPFDDTDTPVIVACFDGRYKNYSDISVYKNETKVIDLGTLESNRLTPQHNVAIDFNNKSGWLAVRCVDTTNPNDKLRFDRKENIDYDWENGIKVSSRLLTLIDIEVPLDKQSCFIKQCNVILNQLREKTSDIIFSPFKGNMKNGCRRRRLDFKTCRAIIEMAYKQTFDTKEEKNCEQLSLF